MWVGRGISIRVNNRDNLLQVLEGGRTRRLFFLGVNSEGNGRDGKTGRLLGREACGMECETEFKPHRTAQHISRIPSSIMMSVGKKLSGHKNLL